MLRFENETGIQLLLSWDLLGLWQLISVDGLGVWDTCVSDIYSKVGRRTLISFTILYQFRFYITEEVLESPCVVDIIDRVADGCFVS